MICLRETHIRHTAYRTSAEAWEFSGNQSAVYRKGFLKRNTQRQGMYGLLDENAVARNRI